MKFILLGNGFDIALGQKTTISWFVDWIKNGRRSSGDELSKDNQTLLEQFIHNFECFLKENGRSLKDNNLGWNYIESQSLEFFRLISENNITDLKQKYGFKYNSRSKDSFFKKCKDGYLIFCYSMQYYYLKVITRKSTSNSFNITNQKLVKFINFTKESDLIMSLNYTNFLEFSKEKQSIDANIYFVHYIIPGVIFSRFIENLRVGTQEGDPLNYATLGDWETFGGKYEINLMENEQARQKYASPIKYWTKLYGSFNTSTSKSFQLLILGNATATTKDFSFLSKDLNRHLFIQNYPKTVINEITRLLEKQPVIEAYVFGYSFSDADISVNRFLKEQLIEKGIFPHVLFFSEDKDNIELIKMTYENLNKFCVTFMEGISYEEYYDNIFFI